MTVTCAGYYENETELFEWCPLNPPGVPTRHREWMGKIVTVIGWIPQFSWCEIDGDGHDLHALHWLGVVLELKKPVPYEELVKLHD